jgi:phospholipid transport system transporter-binding protein
MVDRPAEFELIEGESGVFRLEGELSFGSSVRALKRSERLFSPNSVVTFDMGGIERADSAGLALMLEWIRRSREVGAALQFTHIPEQLLAIARVAGVDGIITRT